MNTSLNKPIKCLFTRFALAAIFVLLISAQAGAAVFTSAATGNWSSPDTWLVGGNQNTQGLLPGINDDVRILSGHTVTADMGSSVNSLNVAGTLKIMLPVKTNLTTNNITQNTSNAIGTVEVLSGNLRVENIFYMTNTLFSINGSASSVTFGGNNDFVRTTEYFRLTNGGELIIENIGKGQGIKRLYNQGRIIFPIGTTDGSAFTFSPVYIDNKEKKPATINATYAVSVYDGVYANGSDGTRLYENAVDKTWTILLLKGDSDAEAFFYWDAADQLPNFNPLNSQFASFDETTGKWSVVASTSVTSNPPSASFAGLKGSVVPGSTPVPMFAKLAVIGGGITPLPVELVFFNAIKKNHEVALTWETASEKNNKGYEVQSSADGKNYEALGFVASQNGNTAVAQRYSYTDKTANKEGLVYYRLKQIDLDGTVTYYQAKVVDLGRFTSSALAYPNPFQEQFRVALETTVTGPAEIAITDITGKTIYAAQHQLQKGVNNILVTIKDQPAGLYFLKAVAGNQTYTNRLMKQ